MIPGIGTAGAGIPTGAMHGDLHGATPTGATAGAGAVRHGAGDGLAHPGVGAGAGIGPDGDIIPDGDPARTGVTTGDTVLTTLPPALMHLTVRQADVPVTPAAIPPAAPHTAMATA